jgi:hypothetical protein
MAEWSKRVSDDDRSEVRIERGRYGPSRLAFSDETAISAG